MHTKTESPRQSESKRGKELELSVQVQDVLVESGNEEQIADRHGRRIWRGSETTRREKNERHPTLAKEDRRQQVKNNLTS